MQAVEGSRPALGKSNCNCQMSIHISCANLHGCGQLAEPAPKVSAVVAKGCRSMRQFNPANSLCGSDIADSTQFPPRLTK